MDQPQEEDMYPRPDGPRFRHWAGLADDDVFQAQDDEGQADDDPAQAEDIR